MNIKPLVGFDNIKFGFTREKVKEILGKASTTEKVDFPDGSSTDSWIYEKLNIELNFDSDEKFRLSRITFHSKNAELDGICIIGKNEEELVKHFPQVYLDEDLGESGNNYEYLEKEISFWVMDGVVKNFTLFVPFDEAGNTILWPK
ncbi:hypothetical protein [Desulfosediminicola flagellatus]|uniref:hypothetical protein n=1 Tax=Desulfosediminicola flagellatus TaxID=2569541 RepID=UPI0010AC5AA1|nr:hypothetical protein [Desulfosediminicola flagellatus]